MNFFKNKTEIKRNSEQGTPRKLPRFMGLVLFASLVFSGCMPISNESAALPKGTIPGGATPSLAGTQWVLTSFGDQETVPYSAPENPVTAIFAEGQMGGKNGCNSYSTEYGVNGNQLKLGAIVSTRMACPGVASQVEQAYMNALASASDYKVEGDILTITYQLGQLTFAKVDAATSSNTTQQNTEATTIILPEGQECLYAGSGATLAFEGKRLNYTCSTIDEMPMSGLIGEIVQDDSGSLTVELATISRGSDGFVLDKSQTVTFVPTQIVLADGTQCAFAGTGATLAFEGERLNYTCGDPSLGLLGKLTEGEKGLWMANKVVLDHNGSGFSISEREVVNLDRIQG